MKRITAVLLAGILSLGMFAIPAAAEDEQVIMEVGSIDEAGEEALLGAYITRVPMLRLYNPNSGEHFYTANEGERNYLVSVGWNYEGYAWFAPELNGDPVYRLYNENAGDHHYTANEGEKNFLVSLGWKDEGIGWRSSIDSGQPLYRQYNPNAKAGAHNYTTSKSENDYLVKLGWKAEGIGWYGIYNCPFVPADEKDLLQYEKYPRTELFMKLTDLKDVTIFSNEPTYENDFCNWEYNPATGLPGRVTLKKNYRGYNIADVEVGDSLTSAEVKFGSDWKQVGTIYDLGDGSMCKEYHYSNAMLMYPIEYHLLITFDSCDEKIKEISFWFDMDIMKG